MAGRILLLLLIAGCSTVSRDVDVWSSPPRLPVGASVGLTLHHKDDVNTDPSWLQWRIAFVTAYATKGGQSSAGYGLELGPRFVIDHVALEVAAWGLFEPSHWTHNDAGGLIRICVPIHKFEPYVGVLVGHDDGDNNLHLFNAGGAGLRPQVLFGLRFHW